MPKKKTTVRYCEYGAPLPADGPKAKLCQACRQRRLEEQRAEHRSLSVEDEARRAETSVPLPGQHMTLREAVEVLRKIEQEREKQIDIRPVDCMMGKE